MSDFEKVGWERKPVDRQQSGGGAATSLPLKTFIDPGATFEGTLRLREDLRIDCEFRGEIITEGTLVVGESGCVEGPIRAREVEICGAVVGDVWARRQLTVRAGARLHGDIESACIEIEKHAFFNGRTTMVSPQIALRGQADSAPASSETAPVTS
jgi:cytoskeletal protein CcmA (bactofilin family)